MIQNNADEIRRFKTEINLVKYAAGFGYQVDRRESSRSSIVMHGPGDDKILVATDRDGHGIYFNIRDDRDHGTIVDFVQRRLRFNLGQVRKELRPWIGDVSAPPMAKKRVVPPKLPQPTGSQRGS